jgi:hypothetical protein
LPLAGHKSFTRLYVYIPPLPLPCLD